MNLEKAYPKQNRSSSLTYRPMFTSVCSTKIDQAREITSKPIGARPTSPCYATACEPVLSFPKGTDPNMEELVVEGYTSHECGKEEMVHGAPIDLPPLSALRWRGSWRKLVDTPRVAAGIVCTWFRTFRRKNIVWKLDGQCGMTVDNISTTIVSV
jgi:hypothetical protein